MRNLLIFILLFFGITSQSHALYKKSLWEELSIISSPENTAPLPKSSFAAAANQRGNGSGWIFGGVLNDFSDTPIYNNYFFQVDPINNLETELLFRQVITDGLEPSARAFPSLAVVLADEHEDVYLFGGGTFPNDIPLPSSDVFWLFDGETKSWTDLSSLGGPSPRLGATTIASGNAIYVFGGIAFDPVSFFILYNDLWRFDTIEQQWTLLSNDTGPAPRHVAMGTINNNGDLTIFGGERVELNPDTFEVAFPIDTSTWTWNIENEQWKQLANGPARNYAAFAGYKGNLIVFGGDASGGEQCADADFLQNPTNDLFSFSPRFGWKKHKVRSLIPPNVKRNSGFVLGKHFYTLGGFDFDCDQGQIFLDSAYRYKLK